MVEPMAKKEYHKETNKSRQTGHDNRDQYFCKFRCSVRSWQQGGELTDGTRRFVNRVYFAGKGKLPKRE